MLTRKQHELLLFIHERLGQGGVSPSFDEMKDALGLKSKSGIHRLITGLEERGFIRRLPHRARALEVLRLPEGLDAARNRSATPKPKFQPNVIKGDFAFAGRDTAPPAPTPAAANETVQLPLYGRIAAGTPIEAIQQERDRLQVPETILGAGEHYVLEVNGDSMIEAGILDGDYVVIRKTDNAATGEIVVALVNGEEATLKRLRRKGASVALEAANPKYQTQIYNPDQVQVQGKLVGLIRRYH